MSKVKKLRAKNPDGDFSDYIDIGANAVNIDMEDGETLENTMTNVKSDIQELQDTALTTEDDPTVPQYVKDITEDDISKWNNIYWKSVE